MYERGEAPRAAFMFANGLVRDPDNEEALNWLLMLYVEKIEKPGMERDILRVLDTQRDGLELYELVETRLSERGEAEKIDALRKMRERGGFLKDPIPEDFSSDESYWDDAPIDKRKEPGADQPADRMPSFETYAVGSAPAAVLDGSSALESAGDEDWSEFDDPFEERPSEDRDGFRRTTATTGVYSSLNAISEEHAREELREYYVRKRKIQIIIGLVLVALIAAALIFAFPAESSDPGPESDTPQQDPEQ